MARRDAKSEPATEEPVSDGPELGPAGAGEDFGAGSEVDASKTPEEVENGTLGQEGSTGASEGESEEAGNFGLGFVQGYESPVILEPGTGKRRGYDRK